VWPQKTTRYHFGVLPDESRSSPEEQSFLQTTSALPRMKKRDVSPEQFPSSSHSSWPGRDLHENAAEIASADAVRNK
jgi:hypothetical protein